MEVWVSGNEDFSKERTSRSRFSTIFRGRRDGIEKEHCQIKKAVSDVDAGPVIHRRNTKFKSSQLRFLVWVGYDRPFSNITEQQQRTCPLLDCGTICPNRETMLKHVAGCPCLSRGLYKCFGCNREERIGMYHVNSCEEPQCIDRIATITNSLRLVKRKLSLRGSHTQTSDGQVAVDNVAYSTQEQVEPEYLTHTLQPGQVEKDPIDTSFYHSHELDNCGHDNPQGSLPEIPDFVSMREFCVKDKCLHYGADCEYMARGFSDLKSQPHPGVAAYGTGASCRSELSAENGSVAQYNQDAYVQFINPAELSASVAPVELPSNHYLPGRLQPQNSQPWDHPWRQCFLPRGPTLVAQEEQMQDNSFSEGMGFIRDGQYPRRIRQHRSGSISVGKTTLPNIVPPTTPQSTTPTFTEKYTLSPAESSTSAATSIESSFFSSGSGHTSQNTSLSSFDSYSPIDNHGTDQELSLKEVECHQISNNSNLYYNLASVAGRNTPCPVPRSPEGLRGVKTSIFKDLYAQPQSIPSSPNFAITPYFDRQYMDRSPSLETPSQLTQTHPETPQSTLFPNPPSSEISTDAESKYKCSTCGHEPAGKQANKASNLKRHLNSHSIFRKRPKCYHPGCGLTFSRSDNLLQHQRLQSHSSDFELQMPATSGGWI